MNMLKTSTVHDIDLYADLSSRGIVHQVTDVSLKSHLKNGSIALYCGFDPTSDDLHVGNLFPLITLRRFQMAGHQPILILGGATGMIGDPSGKSSERNLQSLDQVAKNLEGIKAAASRFLDFGSAANSAKIINNADFYTHMNVLDFLRDVGKHFTVNHMMAKDSVKGRMEDRDHGISYTEFSYMLLQAFDFYYLHQHHRCTLQIGASDQWGNITAGTELIRRKLAHADRSDEDTGGPIPAFGLTHPLITKSDGTKFGKSEKGTVWLNPAKTSPYQLYQFFIQSPDDKVIEWIKFLTFLPLTEIETIQESLKTEPEKKLAQRRLAQEITRFVHGNDALIRAEQATKALFGTEIKELDRTTLLELFSEAPSIQKDHQALLGSGLLLIDALVESGLFTSKGAARKEIVAGGVYLNNERVTDPAFAISNEHLIANHATVLRKGKKSYAVIQFS